MTDTPRPETAPPTRAGRDFSTLRRVRDAYEDSHGEDFGAWLRQEIDAAATAGLPVAAPPAVTPVEHAIKPHVESCERCQMTLPEHLGTYGIGVRGGTAWRCAVCQPIEGPSGRLLRDEVVRRRKRHLTALTPEAP